MKLLALIIFLSCSLAQATTRPFWVLRTPQADTNNIYFVGRTTGASSESEGMATCEKDAKEQLIRQEFGTEIKFDSSQAETLTEVSIESKIQEMSDKIFLKGFARLDVFSESKNGSVAVYVLYSVLKSEIRAEKKRLAFMRTAKGAKIRQIAEESSPKEFNNGGKPKLKKGLKKSQVIAMFGAPETTDNGGESFQYESSEYCETLGGWRDKFYCTVHFDQRNRVTGWYKVLPQYTSDLDD
jgi:hypothetical protein